MSAPPDDADRRRWVRKPRRLSTYGFVALGVIAAAGTIYLTVGDRTVVVYGAGSDLPAYHQIAEPEVRRLELPASEIPEHAVRDRETLIGHYTLRAVRQDRAIDRSQVGPQLAMGTLVRRGIVGFATSSADVLDGRLARGDRVDVLLPARTPSGRQSAAALKGALVLDVRQDSAAAGRYAIIVALARAERLALMASAGTSRLRLVRVATYRRP